MIWRLLTSLMLFSVACKSQKSISFTVTPTSHNFTVDDSIMVTVNYKGFKDSVIVSFSGEYLKAEGWQEFDADVRSSSYRTFNYLRLSGSGQSSFTLKMTDLLKEFGKSKNTFRIVLNYHPAKYDAMTWYHESIPGNEFVVER